MYPAPFEYHRASSVDDALALLAKYPDDGKLIAGGHSLLPVMKLRFAQPAHLIDIRRVQELAGVRDTTVVFGHSHQQFRRSGPNGATLINPGSAGMPLDGDVRAAYALRRDDGEFEFRRVEYDVERVAEAWEKVGGTFGKVAAHQK